MSQTIADWPQVKATAIATGSLKAAAEAHGISHDSVKQRAKREEWPVGRRALKMAAEAQAHANSQIIKASQGTVTRVTSASDALAATLAEGAKETKLGLTKYAARMAKQAADSGLLEEAPLYKAVADIHGKMHPEQQDADRVPMNFFSITVNQEREEKPVIDV